MWVYFLAKKSDASRALERFLSDTRPDGSVQIIPMNGGTEWKGEFERIWDQERIRPEEVLLRQLNIMVAQREVFLFLKPLRSRHDGKRRTSTGSHERRSLRLRRS